MHVSAFRELTVSTEKVRRFGELFRELEQTQGFGLIFFPHLTYFSAYLPWLKYITGGIISEGDKLKKKIAIAKELIGALLLPIVRKRLEEKEKIDNGQEPVDDQMQVLINDGDDAYAIVYVRFPCICILIYFISHLVRSGIFVCWHA